MLLEKGRGGGGVGQLSLDSVPFRDLLTAHNHPFSTILDPFGTILVSVLYPHSDFLDVAETRI